MIFLQLNKYITLNGGSETVMKSLVQILSSHHHQVINMGFHKPEQPYLPQVIDLGSEQLSLSGFFSHPSLVKQVVDAIREHDIDVLLCHNVYHHFPLAQLFKAIKQRTRAKIVLFLHDYKAVCPVYTLFNHGRPCEQCRHGHYWHCVTNRCKGGKMIHSLMLAMDSYVNTRLLDAYGHCDLIISPSRFLCSKIKVMGFHHQVEVINNPVNLKTMPENTAKINMPGRSILYAGRLTAEKGIPEFLQLVRLLPDIHFDIAGRGPMEKEVVETASLLANITYHGYVNHKTLQRLYRKNKYLIVPSVWYENNPMTIIEAMTAGLPVIGSRIGGIPELLEKGRGIIIDMHNPMQVKDIIQMAVDSDKEYLRIRETAAAFVQSLGYDQYYNKFIDKLNTVL